MALSLDGTELCPPTFLHLEAVIHWDFLAGLYGIAQRFAISQTHTAAFVQSKCGVNQIAMVLDQPLNAHTVAVENFFVGLQGQDDVAIGLEPFLFVANQV